ncbi:MAG: protein kinase, partial [Clostridiales bacterium]|nr:protein kinase [Clostridiales bacterium]
LLEGITLKQYINRKGLLGWKESLHFAMQICKAILHAHSKGVIHRDIKPQNIMILKDGSIKVADFGIARLISTQSTLTQESLGSVHYISPEQAKGGYVDARTDIYSLGVVMYEMLTSQLPFVGDSPVSVAIQHISAIPLLPSDINPDVPPGLEDITMRAMEPNLNRRYTTAEEMLRDLEEFRKNPSATFEYVMPAKAIDTMSDDTRPVPQNGFVKAAEPKPRRVQESAPVRKAPPKRFDDLTKDEYRRWNKRARVNAILLGSGIVVVVLVVAFMFMWRNILKDMIVPDNEFMYVPDFSGFTLNQITSNTEYKQNFVFDVAKDPSYSDLYDADIVYDQFPAADQRILVTGEKTPVTLYVSLGKRPMPKMPSLVNTDYRTARNEIEKINTDNPDLNLNLEVVLQHAASDSVTKDYVIETIPEAFETLSRNMTIYIVYSTGPDIVLVTVPDLAGWTYSAAQRELERLNLVLDLPVEFIEDDAPENTVLWNSDAGKSVLEHTKIKLEVSSGPAETPTPEPSEEPPEETPDIITTPPVDETPDPDVTHVDAPDATPSDN